MLLKGRNSNNSSKVHNSAPVEYGDCLVELTLLPILKLSERILNIEAPFLDSTTNIHYFFFFFFVSAWNSATNSNVFTR